jgi:microcompartment protein CcmK/EutM
MSIQPLLPDPKIEMSNFPSPHSSPEDIRQASAESAITFFFSLPAFDPTLLHMLIGRVIGDVVATQKVPSHEGRKILVVQPLNLDGTDRGDPVLALDAVSAGIGDRVLLTTEGFSAMTAVGRPNSPIDSAVIGVIDSVDLHDE